MEIIYFLLLMIILMLLALIISIGQVNKNIIKLYFNLDDKLSFIDNNTLNIYSYIKHNFMKVKDINKV